MATPHDKLILNAILNPLNPNAAVDVPAIEEQEVEGVVGAVETEAKRIEEEGVLAAEKGELAPALLAFDRAIALCPRRASCFNNRAQCHRLRGDTALALVDLDAAVELSGGRGRAACQALTQRAMLRRLQGDDAGSRADYECAAALGSAFARTQLVVANPYAAMCNKMLGDVMGKLQRGQPTDEELPPGPPA